MSTPTPMKEQAVTPSDSSMHASMYLRSLGAREVTCVIYRGNEASRRLHESCGFKATDEDPVDPWGDRDECGVLYRSRL